MLHPANTAGANCASPKGQVGRC